MRMRRLNTENTQNPTPLGGTNEARWIPKNRLAITDTTDYACVLLKPKEISCLLSFLISPTDEQIDNLVKRMNDIFVQHLNESHQSAMRRVVRDWFAALSPSAPVIGEKE